MLCELPPLPVLVAVFAVLAAFTLQGCAGGGSAPPGPRPRPGPDPYSPAALEDEILDLPDAPRVPWRQFSGYIDVSAPGEKNGSRLMFYWFAESNNLPEKDPVMLWTNGGPGCSGLGGLLSEQGPFRAGKDGKTLIVNEFAWNKVANMIFIEQPAGVGFSKANVSINYGDEQAAADNHRFIIGFFARFPQYNKQDFYISSESYGGHYMPTLARKIKTAGDLANFRGVFLGNPITYMMYRNFGQYGTYWGHQLLPTPLWRRYDGANCATSFPPSDTCSNITAEMDTITSGFDPYALDFPTCQTALAVGRHERWTFKRAIDKANAHAKGKLHLLQSPPPYEACVSDYMTTYLNRADVQAALHAKAGTKWSMCSNDVGEAYNSTDVISSMVPVWQELIKGGDLRIMIVSGDDDSICASLGTQQFIWDMGYEPILGKNWVPWHVDDQVAGFQTDFQVPSPKGVGSFSYATVHSAGHMIPACQPARSLALLQSFLGLEVKAGGHNNVVV